MKIKDIIYFLESWAPKSYQESYDNAGLITGDKNWEVKGVLCTLDCLEQTIEEAIKHKCNLIVAHHPIVFTGLKQLNGKNYVERAVIKAIKNDIAIYAIHTNLDNVHSGVNMTFAQKIGIENPQILMPKKQLLSKLEVYCPEEESEKMRAALFAAGVGEFSNYSECSFNVLGEGTFMPSEKANPAIGEKGKRHHGKEIKIECVFPSYSQNEVLTAMRNAHSYEEIAYQVIALENQNQFVGSGMFGDLKKEMPVKEFFNNLKDKLNVNTIKHTELCKTSIKKVALMGGSGSFGIRAAIGKNADIYISSDFKYHEFFDADNQIIIADIGHYESEALTIGLLSDKLMEKFPNFVVLLTELNTNPVRYY